MAAHVLSVTIALRLPGCRSLKEKRSVLRSIVDGSRRRYGVAAAETDHQDRWQLAEVAFAAVSGSATHTGEVIDEVERFVWSFPEVEVIDLRRDWVEVR